MCTWKFQLLKSDFFSKLISEHKSYIFYGTTMSILITNLFIYLFIYFIYLFIHSLICLFEVQKMDYKNNFMLNINWTLRMI